MKRSFIETSSFSKSIREFSKDDPDLLLRIQQAILSNPEVGDLVSGSSGARKLRIAAKGRGKSGSYRTIYYDFNKDGEVYLIALYGKNQKSNISEDEKKIISKLIKYLHKMR